MNDETITKLKDGTVIRKVDTGYYAVRGTKESPIMETKLDALLEIRRIEHRCSQCGIQLPGLPPNIPNLYPQCVQCSMAEE